MLLEFFAAIFTALAAGGVAMLVGRLSGGALPRWFTPVCAGLALFAYVLWSEYTWYGRTVETMPDSLVVVSAHESRQPFRPWTYAVPFVSRFAAVNQDMHRTNPNVPGKVLTELVLFTRWQPPSALPIAVDCELMRRADISDGAEFSETGDIVGAEWFDLDPADPVMDAACGAR